MEGTRQRRESEEQLRTVKCYKCIHCKDEKGMRKMSFTDSLCAISGRWGSQKRAYWCLDFEGHSSGSDTTEYHGHRIRNRQVEDWRTKNQWEEAGYFVKFGEQPTLMFKDARSAEENNERGLYGYYLPEQVERWVR